MAFTDSTRNFGILAIIVAVIGLASGVVVFFDDEIDTKWRTIAGVGSILANIIMLLAGYAIFSGNIPSFMDKLFPEGPTSKFGVLTGYTAAIGVASIIGLGSGIAEIVMGVLVGLVLLFIVWVLTNDRKGIVERILWVILLVVYFLGIVGSILAMFSESFINTVVGLCGCLMYLLAFIYLFDESVKKKFGM
jgi:hypothetical protein